MDITTEGGFRKLYQQHYAVLHRTAYGILGDSSTAEDAVHQVFLKLWEQRKQVRITDNPGGYLSRAVINTALNYLKKHRHLAPIETLLEQEMAEDTSGRKESQEQLKAIQQKLGVIVDSLPPKCKLIFALSRYEGLSNQESADHLGVTKKTVENQLNKAFSSIRNTLGPYLKYLSGLLAALSTQIFF